jgi:hypothetical protein
MNICLLLLCLGLFSSSQNKFNPVHSPARNLNHGIPGTFNRPYTG